MEEHINCPSCGAKNNLVARLRTDVETSLAKTIAPQMLPPAKCTSCDHKFEDGIESAAGGLNQLPAGAAEITGSDREADIAKSENEPIACPECGTQNDLLSQRRTDVPENVAKFLAPNFVPPTTCSNCGYEFRETITADAMPQNTAGQRLYGDLRVGSVLGRSLRILTRNLVPFCFLAFLIMGIDAWLTTIALAQLEMSNELRNNLSSIATYLLATPLLSAFLIYGTIAELRGQHANFSDCIMGGLSLMFPVILVALLQSILLFMGFMALVVPGLIIMTMVWVAIPAAVVERPGIFASLSRSGELTKGFRWQIFGIVICLGLVQFCLNIVTLQLFEITSTALAVVDFIVISRAVQRS
jgi:rubredoxin